jgi:hypothetical protein
MIKFGNGSDICETADDQAAHEQAGGLTEVLKPVSTAVYNSSKIFA